MKRRVTFQSKSSTQDAFGQRAETYTDVYSVGAVIRPKTISTTSTQDLQIFTEGYEFEVPFGPRSRALTLNNFAMISGVRYNIATIDDITNFGKSVIITVRRFE